MPDRPLHPMANCNRGFPLSPSTPTPYPVLGLFHCPRQQRSDWSSTASWWEVYPSASLNTDSKWFPLLRRMTPTALANKLRQHQQFSFCNLEEEPMWVNKKGPGTRTAWKLARRAHRGGADRWGCSGTISPVLCKGWTLGWKDVADGWAPPTCVAWKSMEFCTGPL